MLFWWKGSAHLLPAPNSTFLTSGWTHWSVYRPSISVWHHIHHIKAQQMVCMIRKANHKQWSHPAGFHYGALLWQIIIILLLLSTYDNKELAKILPHKSRCLLLQVVSGIGSTRGCLTGNDTGDETILPLLRYPLYQLGNPQLRIFRPNWFLTLVRPGKEQPPDTVQFRIPME